MIKYSAYIYKIVFRDKKIEYSNKKLSITEAKNDIAYIFNNYKDTINDGIYKVLAEYEIGNEIYYLIKSKECNSILINYNIVNTDIIRHAMNTEDYFYFIKKGNKYDIFIDIS